MTTLDAKVRLRASITIERTYLMKTKLISLSLLISLASVTGAANAGCLKGALVGGAAGHFAHHHSLAGAAVGCAVGHHMSKKKAREQLQQDNRYNGQQGGGYSGRQDSGYGGQQGSGYSGRQDSGYGDRQEGHSTQTGMSTGR